MIKKIAVIIVMTLYATNVSAQFAVFEGGPNVFTNIVSTGENIWSTVSKEVLEPAVQELIERLLDKVVQKSLNLGGELLITDFRGALDGTVYESLERTYLASNSQYQKLVNENTCLGSDCNLTPAEQAQQNHELRLSGLLLDKRNITNTISEISSNRLNNDTLTRVVSGKTNVLSEEDFKDGDFWNKYVELTNPEKSKVGLNGLLTGVLSSQATAEREIFLQNLQTPQKFLDQTRCLEYTINETTGEQNCLREIVITPGAQISEKINESILKDERLAGSAEGLVAFLVSSGIGKATDQLLKQGVLGASEAVNNIGRSSSSSVFNPTTSRSEFDILGNEDDGFLDNSTPSSFTNLGTQGGAVDPTFIGGPDDIGSAQIIIDLEEVLEKNVDLADLENSYFEQLSFVRSDNKEVIKYLDQCVPGPDHDWKTRFTNIFPTTGTTDQNQINALGLNNTEKMFNDPKVNIPGALSILESIKSVINETKKEDITNDQRIDSLSEVISGISFIKEQVLIDFNQQKASISPHLVLYSEDWENLSDPEQEEVFGLAVDNGYYLLKGKEDVQYVIDVDNKLAENAVKAMAWKLWREQTPKEKQIDLRYNYYLLRNKLSSDSFVAEARAKFNKVAIETKKSQNLLQDCLVFRSYSLGSTEEELQKVIKEATDILDLHSRIEAIHPRYRQALPNLLQALHSINLSKARDDDEITSFLQSEYEKQLSGNESLFNTTIMTGGVSRSILGFASEDDKEEYFERYSDEDLNGLNKNDMTIKDILNADNLLSTYKRAQGPRGYLFCRHEGTFDAGRRNQPQCLQDWYIADSLDYELAFAGI